MARPPPGGKSPVLPPLAVTMGEPAGIGVEITLKTWYRRGVYGLPPFYLIADPDHVRRTAAALAPAFGKPSRANVGAPPKVIEIADPGEARARFDDGLPVFPQALAEAAEPGRLNPANAPAVLASIETAVRHAQAGAAAAVVTNPIQKSVLHKAGFRHPGHTEFLGQLCGGVLPVMMLSCPGLKTVPITIHMPLQQAVASLNTEMIFDQGMIVHQALYRDLGYDPPRLAVSGLNPHASEGGDLGSAEADIIQPAIDRLRAEGVRVTGPMAADSMFHDAARQSYDVAICMYHDQALVPVKALGFDYGINLTLGLPIVRTSPDHGTALDIAGQGRANSLSLNSALAHAALIARHRAGSI